MMKSIVSVLLVSTLLLVGCTPPTTSNLITALNAVSDASSVAVVVTSSLVALGKLDPAVAAQVSMYSTGVSQAVNVSVAELNGPDSNPTKIATITAAFAKVAAPAFGSNAPEVSAAIDAVSAAIKIFVNQLTSSGLLKLAKAAPTAKITLTSGDKTVLKQITKKTAQTQLAAAKLVAKK